MPIPKSATIRVNLAWVDYKGAKRILRKLKKQKRKIFLDYPRGRKKPPNSEIEFFAAIQLANKFKVNYFAISNVETPIVIQFLKKQTKVKLVPKIETVKGVENIGKIAKEVKMVLLDKEDLWTDCKGQGFEELVEKVRNCGIKVLELQGVIFQ